MTTKSPKHNERKWLQSDTGDSRPATVEQTWLGTDSSVSLCGQQPHLEVAYGASSA